jgi:hypothetical protein
MDRPEYELVTNAEEKYENQDIFSMISPNFLRLKHHRIIYNKCRHMEAAGCSISDSCRERGDQVCMHDFFIPGGARSMDARRSTGTNRVTPHSYGNGKQAREGVVVVWVWRASSEGVVVHIVSGSANACGWMRLDVTF